MSRLTRSTTSRFLNLFLRPWAIRPSISGTYGPIRAHLDLGFRAVLIEDGLDALLLAALDQAPILGEIDGDPLTGNYVASLPRSRVADEHHALLGVVVIGAAGGPHTGVAGYDPDIAGRHDTLDAIRLRVRVDFHAIGVLDRIVLLGHHVALEDRETFLLHALEAVGVDDDRPVLAFSSRGRGR